jgi:hypothetical protein
MITRLSLIKKGLFSVTLTVLLITSFGTQKVMAETDPRITIYTVPAITDEKILPTTSISDDNISSEISLKACPGEYEPVSFIIHANEGIAGLEAVSNNLVGNSGIIPSDNVDIRVVKCWYQAGVGIEDPHYDKNKKVFTPELLLKDDALVKIDGEENYLKLTSGEYTWISEVKSGSWDNPVPGTRPLNHEFPVQDSQTLQPVDLIANENKQFWITIKVPDNAQAGLYSGSINLSTAADGLLGQIQLQLEVLPIELKDPYLMYGLYYYGVRPYPWPPYDTGTIHHERKSWTQFRAELKNMVEHGVTVPTVRHFQLIDELELFAEDLQARNEAGIAKTPLLLHGRENNLGFDATTDPVELEALKVRVREIVQTAEAEGYSEVYFYGIDEVRGTEQLGQRAAWEAIHEAGGKVFVACSNVGGNTFDNVGDLLDLAVFHGTPTASEAARWHSVNNNIVNYSNPQVGVEKPETYRRNYGLLLWQADYDGALDYAYQAAYCHIWNDFDHVSFRDHVFAYPTIDGVIDTIQWEGWREGVDDVRYLTTLIELIEEAKVSGSKDTSSAESWLNNLKNSNLMTEDLDAIRSQMINYILYLLPDSINNQPNDNPDINNDGNINVLDLIAIGQHLGETGTSGWIPEDINQDGTIDILDLLLIRQYWTG